VKISLIARRNRINLAFKKKEIKQILIKQQRLQPRISVANTGHRRQ